MSNRVHIIGVGSPFGDDRLGWEAVEAMQRAGVIAALPPARIKISVLDRPGALLPHHWRADEIVILLDAIRSGAAPGTRHCLDAGELPATMPCRSSHAFGMADAIALARQLGNMPPRLLVRGLEADTAWPGPSLSPSVTAALPDFITAVVRETVELAGIISAGAGSGPGHGLSGFRRGDKAVVS